LLLRMAANVRKIRTFLKQNVTSLAPAARTRNPPSPKPR
jgi:hypothetical protein